MENPCITLGGLVWKPSHTNKPLMGMRSHFYLLRLIGVVVSGWLPGKGTRLPSGVAWLSTSHSIHLWINGRNHLRGLLGTSSDHLGDCSIQTLLNKYQYHVVTDLHGLVSKHVGLTPDMFQKTLQTREKTIDGIVTYDTISRG